MNDQLSWDKFFEFSKNVNFPSEVKDFNRLIAHTNNYFAISGYGAFTPGYVVVITKEFIPSFSLIKNNQLEELHYFLEILKKVIKKIYKRKTVLFEHGMCACIGGLDRAHLHIMSINPKIKNSSIKKSINTVLEKRKAGIRYIVYNGYKLENRHDINTILDFRKKNRAKSDKIKVIGKLLKLNNIKNFKIEKWPFATLNHVKKGGHYVYFKTDNDKTSFLTKYNFETQLGREIVFDLESNNKSFKEKHKRLILHNPWQWQNNICEENILKTIKDFKIELRNYYKKNKKKFNIQIL